MRERITFVLPPGADIDPEKLQISPTQLHGPTLRAAREDRLIFGLNDLPAELARLLPHIREFALRWASPSPYETIEPFVSRVSPGLHVSFALLDGQGVEIQQRICNALQQLSNLNCTSTEGFTINDVGHTSSLPRAFLYEAISSPAALLAWAAKEVCPEGSKICQLHMRRLSGAVSLDVSWDLTSKNLKVSWLSPLKTQGVEASTSSERRTEVGILTQDNNHNQRPHELGLSGLLTVIGENDEASGTVFAFPSRHRATDQVFSMQALQPTGLHPTLQLRLGSNEAPVADEHCAPYAFLSLPKFVFPDRYQLADALFLANKNLTALHYTSLPIDLEAPAYTTISWGSHLLLELAPPSSGQPEEWTAEVPLHLRYLKPSPTGTRDVEIPYPAVFWACGSSTDAAFSNNPFDRNSLGYDDLFDQSTVFWHVAPVPVIGEKLMLPLSVPVMTQEAFSWVSSGTAVTIALGFAWVLWKLAAALATSGYGSRSRLQEAATLAKKNE